MSAAAEDAAEQTAEVESADKVDTGAAGMMVGASGGWVGGRCAGANHGHDQSGS